MFPSNTTTKRRMAQPRNETIGVILMREFVFYCL